MDKSEKIKIQQFKSYDEILSRECFKENNSVTLSNFKEILGHYKISPKLTCQVYKEQHKRNCHQKHNDGYVILLKDNTESIVGGHCAKKDFGADENFKLKVSQYERAKKLEEETQKLKANIDSIEKLEKRIIEKVDDCSKVALKISILEEKLSDTALKKLKDAGKKGRLELDIEYIYEEVDDDGNKRTSRVPHRVLAINCPNIWESKLIEQEAKILEHKTNKLKSVNTDQVLKLKDLNRINRDFEDVHRKLDETASTINAFKSFIQNDNIHIFLSLIDKNHNNRHIIVETFYRIKHGQPLSSANAKSYVSEFDKSLRQKNKNRSFKIIL